MSTGPNPFAAAWSMLRARRLKPPRPGGGLGIDHGALAPILDRLGSSGIRSLVEMSGDLDDYRDFLTSVDPDELTASGSLAFWINLYNAGALSRAGKALSGDLDSVLRVPGAFSAPWATIAGETMSLDDIEHGKIRRFGDPRIHGALVCGSVSCPTLRAEPFTGSNLGDQLDDQMKFFLANGGAAMDHQSNTLRLTRVLKWYGGDFVRPSRMPTLRPVRAKHTAVAISKWLDHEDATAVRERSPSIEFASYDWGLGCSVA